MKPTILAFAAGLFAVGVRSLVLEDCVKYAPSLLHDSPCVHTCFIAGYHSMHCKPDHAYCQCQDLYALRDAVDSCIASECEGGPVFGDVFRGVEDGE
jgi:hypothetical protein